MKPWQRTGQASVTKVGFRTVVHKTFVMNSGQEMQADIYDPEGTVSACVIALTPDNEVIIARQFRCGSEKIMDELPGGQVDPNETPEVGVERELLEETGYAPEAGVTFLGSAFISAWSHSQHYYYLAQNCRKVSTPTSDDQFEDIEVRTISIGQLIDNAKNARMTDIQAVFMAYEQLKELEKQ